MRITLISQALMADDMEFLEKQGRVGTIARIALDNLGSVLHIVNGGKVLARIIDSAHELWDTVSPMSPQWFSSLEFDDVLLIEFDTDEYLLRLTANAIVYARGPHLQMRRPDRPPRCAHLMVAGATLFDRILRESQAEQGRILEELGASTPGSV